MTNKPIVGEVLDVTRHRNGICGAPFYLVRFWTGEGVGPVPRVLVATVFDSESVVAVIDPADPESKWRGDNFEPELRAVIAKRNR